MAWHYQLMRHKDPDGDIWYGIHEYYTNIEGGPMYSANPVPVLGDTPEEVEKQLHMILNDLRNYDYIDYK